jgi:hypothetical protein
MRPRRGERDAQHERGGKQRGQHGPRESSFPRHLRASSLLQSALGRAGMPAFKEHMSRPVVARQAHFLGLQQRAFLE